MLRKQQDKQVITRFRSWVKWAPRLTWDLAEDWRRALLGQRKGNTKNGLERSLIWALGNPTLMLDLLLLCLFLLCAFWSIFVALYTCGSPSLSLKVLSPSSAEQLILANLAHSTLISNGCLGACLTGVCNVKASQGRNPSIYPFLLFGFQAELVSGYQRVEIRSRGGQSQMLLWYPLVFWGFFVVFSQVMKKMWLPKSLSFLKGRWIITQSCHRLVSGPRWAS